MPRSKGGVSVRGLACSLSPAIGPEAVEVSGILLAFLSKPQQPWGIVVLCALSVFGVNAGMSFCTAHDMRSKLS